MQTQAGERPTITTSARAKVNLALSVGPPSENGMHPIASWMARLDLADDLTLTRLDEGDLSRYAVLWHEDAPRKTEIDWSITSDLAVRAHLLLQEELGRDLPVQLKMEKRVPVGAGLGGGSADAASMLLAVDELFGLELNSDQLVELGARLGSDVPYCLHGGAALVEGLGETLERTPAVSGTVLLALPAFGCATGAVYKAYDDEPRDLRADDVRTMARSGTLDVSVLFNDLEAPARRAQPALDRLLNDLRAMASDDLAVHLTGSGSACFAIAPAGNGSAVHALADAIEDQLEGVETVICALC